MKISVIRLVLLFFILLLISACEYIINREVADSEIPDVPDINEIVMNKGMRITALAPEGTIIITAGKGLKRSYTWEGETRSVVMWPRKERWYGSMGIYYPGPGNHWKEHKGIRRGVVQEGQQHFDTIEDALEWLKRHRWCVYKNDGLVVCYSKSLERRQLNVDVWQILFGGKTISKYQEIDTMKALDRDKERSNLHFINPEDARRRKICHVHGEKPKTLPGSQDDKIKVEFLP